jgi:hypothetical protein
MEHASARVCVVRARAHTWKSYTPEFACSNVFQNPQAKEINRRPTILDLKYSGDIAGLSDVVLLLFVPESDREEPTGEDQSIIGKIREGCKSPLACGLAPTALSSRRETTGQRPGLRKN